MRRRLTQRLAVTSPASVTDQALSSVLPITPEETPLAGLMPLLGGRINDSGDRRRCPSDDPSGEDQEEVVKRLLRVDCCCDRPDYRPRDRAPDAVRRVGPQATPPETGITVRSLHERLLDMISPRYSHDNERVSTNMGSSARLSVRGPIPLGQWSDTGGGAEDQPGLAFALPQAPIGMCATNST